MRHFHLEGWADFARQQVSPQQKAAMQDHLDRGCQRCRKIVEMWQSVLDTAGREASYQPQESAVRSLKGYYALYKPQKPLLGAVLARLISDSFLQPLPAGVRSSAPAARQFVYRAENLIVDLRLESQPGSDRISLIGQVLDSQHPDAGPGSVLVILLRDGETAAETASNEYGEFHLEFQPHDGLMLSLRAGEKGSIIIPLQDLEVSRP